MKKQLLTIIKEFLDERKVEDVKIIDVSNLTPFASNYVLVTAPNSRALEAMSEMLKDDLEEKGFEVRGVDGTSESGWVIVDAGDVLVQFFIESKRKEMGLDEMLDKAQKRLIDKQA